MGLLSGLVRGLIQIGATAIGGPIAGAAAAAATAPGGSGISGRLKAAGGSLAMSKLGDLGGAGAEGPNDAFASGHAAGAVEGSFIPPEIAQQMSGDPLSSFALDDLKRKVGGGSILPNGGLLNKYGRF